ncbi:60S ribosomal protein L28-1-like [Pyrus ussuriensis x Pyrus communis]|uniref:60S ribosomal protein L28-1-like n=1 Tax=Pyrus ussuriensis x Pyrus communis TaxID=2448454 RepID=A0A5N5GBX9_9ROSA|nr:60S ribosomal protein L28-1-like [Pyrus ussuriensis x Pyrus communis]
MGSSGETSEKSIDASVGTLVWVRRRNGSWWPGRIMGLDELPDSCPAALLHKSVMKQEFRRMAKAVVNQVADNHYRPDLKKAALARLSAVHKSLKIAKSGVKKRNRQAVRVYGRK